MKQLFALFLVLQCYCFCTAQSNASRNHFNLLSVKEGMPEGRILDMLQDKEGYIWIATQNGLVRYDGYKPNVYDFGIKDPYGIIVQKLLEDSKGRLWAALRNGLFVYDRAHNSFINCLQWKDKGPHSAQEDAAGNIWLSLGDTVVRYDPVTKRSEGFSSKAKGIYHLDATDFYIYKDKAQRIWVCSSNGLYEYNAKAGDFIAHLTHSDSSKQISTWSLQEDAQQPGIFYFDGYDTYPNGMNEAFCRYDSHTGSITLFHHKQEDINSIASDILTGMYTDSKGRLWITNNAGLSLFNASNQNFTNYVPNPANAFNNTTSGSNIIIKEDKAGNLWISSGAGLYYFNVNTKQFHRDTVDNNFSSGLVGNVTGNLFIDRSDIIWLNAERKGLQWMNTRRSKFIQYGNGSSADIFFKGGAVNSFTKAQDGSIWIGAAHGLYKQLSNSSFNQIQFLPGKNNDISLSCFYDSKGLVWIGTYKEKARLYCYNAVTGKSVDYSYVLNDTASLGLTPVRSFFEDHTGDIWIGTNTIGVIRFNRKLKTFTKFPFIRNGFMQNNNTIADAHGALDDYRVFSIYEDKEGVLWVGTNGGGLNRFNRDKGTFTSYVGKSPGFSSVFRINEDSKGHLWAGTYLGGLFMLNENRDSIKRYSETDGLLSDGILCTEEDNKGNIWAATRRGFSILDPASGKIANIASINNFGGGDVSLKTKEGNFYFSTSNGFVALNPDDFAADPETPIVHIESVHLTTFIKDKPKDSAIVIDTIRKYSFRYNENRLSFNYTGLYYKDPLATQYAYKLDGYDEDWVQAGTQRTVTYTNLSAGTYTFHVKAANADGVWSDGNETISFSIMPPWWQTWWAYILYAVFAAAAIWGFAVYRSRALRERNKRLEYKIN